MRNEAIGVFDSGYGGLTVLKELRKALPTNNFIYLGDNARAPYGTKSYEEVYVNTLEAVKWFFKKGCSLVILACNTASAKALRTIQQNDLPKLGEHRRVLGVIRPTAEVIGEYTITNHIGILGTLGTINSNSYVLEIEKFFPQLKVVQQACTQWVQLIEDHNQDERIVAEDVNRELSNLLNKDATLDTILLACTHYPLLLPVIEKYLPPQINVISQGEIVAQKLVDYLERHPEIENNLAEDSKVDFFTTGNVSDFEKHASLFYEQAVIASHTKIDDLQNP